MVCYKGRFVLTVIAAFLAAIRVFFRSGVDTSLKCSLCDSRSPRSNDRGRDPHLSASTASLLDHSGHIWPRSDALVIVRPKTVIGWHRAGFAFPGAGDRDRAAATPR